MKILITGGSGLLGSSVALYFRDYFDVTASYASHEITINGCKMIKLDITNINETMDITKKINPDVIVHTAALVGINVCEKEPELAYKINVIGTKNIASAAKETNSKIVYISTDYVFDGKKGMYKENDLPNPINYYGKTKLEGESLIDIENNAVIRTSIYGWNIVIEKKSFSTWIIEELSNNNQINIFADQYNSMMLVNNCAEALKEIIDKDFNGLINIASSERISKYNFAIKLADIFGFDRESINPIKNEVVPGAEKRPLDVSLDISNAKKELKTKLMDVKHSLLEMEKLRDKGYLKNFYIDK